MANSTANYTGATIVGGKPYFLCNLTTECHDLTGHTRTACFPDEIPVPANYSSSGAAATKISTNVCACRVSFSFEQAPSHSPDPKCFTADCMYGPEACTGLNPMAYFQLVANSGLWVLLSLYLCTHAIVLLVSLKRHGAPILNAAGSTLISVTLASFFAGLWFAQHLVVIATGSGWFIIFRNIGIPAAAVFGSAAYLNLALVWIQVAAASKSLARTGSNISRNQVIFVAAFCSAFAVVEIVCFAILQQPSIGAGAALLFIIVIMVLYLVGGRRLVQATRGPDNSTPLPPRLRRVVTTSRNIAIFLVAFILSNVLCKSERVCVEGGRGGLLGERPFFSFF